jgi:hypothetical protein
LLGPKPSERLKSVTLTKLDRQFQTDALPFAWKFISLNLSGRNKNLAEVDKAIARRVREV